MDANENFKVDPNFKELTEHRTTVIAQPFVKTSMDISLALA